MQKDNYKWVDVFPTFEDGRILSLIKGISYILLITENEVAITNLSEKLGVLRVEADKRGLNYE